MVDRDEQEPPIGAHGLRTDGKSFQLSAGLPSLVLLRSAMHPVVQHEERQSEDREGMLGF